MASTTTVAIRTTAVHVISSGADIVASVLGNPERGLFRAAFGSLAVHIRVLVAGRGLDLAAGAGKRIADEGLAVVEAVDGRVCGDVATAAVETAALALDCACGGGGADGQGGDGDGEELHL